MKIALKTCIALSIFMIQGNVFAQPTDSLAVALKSERATLLAIDSSFSNLSAEKGAGAAFLTYMDDSASIFPAGANTITGREMIKKHYEDQPNNTVLTWKPLKAGVSSSRDLGYTYGTYLFKYPDNNGHPAYSRGKYVTVWKKQADGSWKFILDIGNQTPLPPQQ